MKKIVIALIIVLLAVGSWFGYTKFFAEGKKEKSKAVVSKKRNPVNLLALEKRPYVALVPREDGRELFMTITNLKNKEAMVEYELEYQAGTMIQGVFGRIDFQEEPDPVTKKLLLGSCSKGKCKYDEDVSGGSLTLYFEGKEDYSLKSEFTLNQMSEKQGLFSSRDTKVSLDVGEDGLAEDTFVVVFSTMGLPKEVKGDILAGPIGFFTPSKATIDEATLTFKGVKETDSLKVLGWNNNQWQEYEVEAGEAATAIVDQLTTFVLVKD